MNKSLSLREAAPGLYSSLKKILLPEDLASIEKSYTEVATRGGIEESPVIREVDASFNPRPARIATLVLTDAKPTNLTKAILLALWSSLILDAATDPQWSQVPEDLTSALDRISSINGTSLEDIDEVVVAVALRLDQVRHLHMTTLNINEKMSFLESVEALVTNLLLSHSELPILKKLSHAIHQQRRIVGEG